DPVMRWVFVVAVSASLLSRPYLQLLPAFVVNHLQLGPEALSLLLIVTGAGALAGSAFVASVGHLPGRGRLFIGAAFATAALVALLGTRDDLAGAAVICFALGICVLMLMGLSSGILQTIAPDHLLGRVMAVHFTTFMGVMPLGQLLLGSLGSVFGIENVYVGCGIAAAFVALVALSRASGLRDLGMPRAVEPQVAAAIPLAD